ncbi:MAG TPA: Gfo/Idh/MocA family oxidoreductase [Bacteroidales bacterium]|nr:Gfo/Idh/MocA family oxidoreductase [Bacteroidales bacterium]
MNSTQILKPKSNLAFIGTGWIGLNRMSTLIEEELCNPVAIVDPDEMNARKAMDLAPGAIQMYSLDDVIQMKPDGVVIATPSALHASQCMAFLEHGIPVFCQKPLARTAEESYSVITAASRADRLLGVDLSYRYTDAMQKIYSISRNELGGIFAVDLVFNNAYGPDKPWFYNPRLSGGGCLIDLGVHMMDLALWILDFPAVRNVDSILFSKGRIVKESDADITEDYASAQVLTVNGTLIRLVCSWNLPAGQNAEIRASFYGTKASALFYNINGSFYDFEAAFCHGTSRKIISTPPDDWGGKALIDWTRSLQVSTVFRKSAFEYYETASVLDMIYKRQLTPQPLIQ